MQYKDHIYLDHQASTPVAPVVLEKMLPFFQEQAGNPHSSEHIVGWKSAEAVEAAKESIASLIGAASDEIIFTSGATESNNFALFGLCRGTHTKARKRILVSSIEHKCTLASAYALERQYGFTIDVLPVNSSGRILLDALEEALDEDVLMVSALAVNNEIGTIQNIEQIGMLARQAGAIFHCDGAQAPVAMDMSKFADSVDLLSLSAHKMCGPQGIGAIYVRRELQEQMEPMFYGGGQQNGIRPGTLALPLCVGMGAAAELLEHPSAEGLRKALRAKRDYFVSLLRRGKVVITVNGEDSPARHPGNANIQFHGHSAHEIIGALQPRVAASSSSACSSGIPETSHVLSAIGLSSEQANASVRFSLGFSTTYDELEIAKSLIEETLEKAIGV